LSTLACTVTSLSTPQQLYDLLDPDVMWYSVGVSSSFTCNDALAYLGAAA
jgi:hypothetical protein